MNTQKRPPQTCRVTIADAQLENGTEITMNTNLEWRGEVWIRSDEDMDDLYRLHACGSSLLIDAGAIEFLGRPDFASSISDAVKRGESIDLPPA